MCVQTNTFLLVFPTPLHRNLPIRAFSGAQYSYLHITCRTPSVVIISHFSLSFHVAIYLFTLNTLAAISYYSYSPILIFGVPVVLEHTHHQNPISAYHCPPLCAPLKKIDQSATASHEVWDDSVRRCASPRRPHLKMVRFLKKFWKPSKLVPPGNPQAHQTTDVDTKRDKDAEGEDHSGKILEPIRRMRLIRPSRQIPSAQGDLGSQIVTRRLAINSLGSRLPRFRLLETMTATQVSTTG